MNWQEIWLNIFGPGSWLGLDKEFWIAMSVVALIVIRILFSGACQPRNLKMYCTLPIIFGGQQS